MPQPGREIGGGRADGQAGDDPGANEHERVEPEAEGKIAEHQRRKGDLLSSLSSDVNEIESSVVSSVQVVFREPLMLIGYVVMLFMMSVKLTLFTLLVLQVQTQPT